MRTRLAALLALLASCSFGLPRPPSPPAPKVMPDCTSDRTLPVLDLVTAVGTGVLGVALVAKPLDCSADNGSCDEYARRMNRGFGTIFLVTAAVYGLSALIGFGKTGDCRDAIRKHNASRDVERAR